MQDGLTALMLASMEGHSAVVQMLAAHGADLEEWRDERHASASSESLASSWSQAKMLACSVQQQGRLGQDAPLPAQREAGTS